jgi:hypothetical protein
MKNEHKFDWEYLRAVVRTFIIELRKQRKATSNLLFTYLVVVLF